jgi:hypothetical protein
LLEVALIELECLGFAMSLEQLTSLGLDSGLALLGFIGSDEGGLLHHEVMQGGFVFRVLCLAKRSVGAREIEVSLKLA